MIPHALLTGMQVFELTVGSSLFQYETHEDWNLTKEENMLHQMATLTGDKFMAAQLNIWLSAPEYFNTDCESHTLCSCKV